MMGTNFKVVCLAAALFLPPTLLGAQTGPRTDREQGIVNALAVWKQALGGIITGIPAVQAESVVAALDGGNIRAYSTSGRPLWNYWARGKIMPYITRSMEGTSYISRTSGALIAVNRAGRELWQRSPGGPLSGPAVSGWDGRIFVPCGNRLSCYTASGNLLWSHVFDAHIAVSPRLEAWGGVILALENREALRIGPFGAITRWRLPAIPALLVSLSPAPGGGLPRVMALYPDGTLEILGRDEEWYTPADIGTAKPLLPRLPSPPIAAASRGTQAAVVTGDGQVFFISADEALVLWTGESHIKLRGQIRPAPEEAEMYFDERGIYVLSPGGATCFTALGRRMWFTTLENSAAVPAFGDDGVLYAGGKDWILYAYHIEDRSRTRKQSLYGPAPDGTYRTGNPPPSPWADYPFRFEEKELKGRLDRIGQAVIAGTVGEYEMGWLAYLMEVVSADLNRPGASVARPEVQAPDRAAALLLLGRIGSRETIPFLANVFRKDADPMIKTAAAEAVGLIGVDPEGTALRAFLEYLTPAFPRDDQVTLAIAAATGALCRFSGPPLSDAGSKILTLLAGAGQSNIVQQQARRELLSLRAAE